ncbi:MAG: DMT family transporter [Actinomycetota bacterium]
MSTVRRTLPLVVVAVLAVSSSAVLVRWADAPAEALAFWRTAGGAVLLAPAAARAARRTGGGGPDRRQWVGIAVAGVALAVHFSTWLASLELTSVAASVTLVTTAPLLIAIGWAAAGRRPPARTWLAIAVALVGVAIITLGDPSPSAGAAPPDPGLGNALALVGAGAMAVYLVAGDRVRSGLTTSAYAARAYAVAAVALAVYAAVAGIELGGYDRTTWLAIVGMIIGPQLAGHTVLNLLLARLGSVTVSTLLLAEPVGAGLLVWLLFGEVPPVAAFAGAPLVLGAVALQLRTPATAAPAGPADDDEAGLSDAGRRGAGRPGPGG